MRITKVMTSQGVQLKLQNTEWTISLEILKQCFLNQFNSINFFSFMRQFYLHFINWIARVLGKVLQPSFRFTFFIANNRAVFIHYCSTLPWPLVAQYSSQGIQGFHVLLLSPFSASSATSSVYLRLLSLARLLTFLSFSRYSSCHLCFSLSDLALLLFVTEALLSYNLMVDRTR